MGVKTTLILENLMRPPNTLLCIWLLLRFDAVWKLWPKPIQKVSLRLCKLLCHGFSALCLKSYAADFCCKKHFLKGMVVSSFYRLFKNFYE